MGSRDMCEAAAVLMQVESHEGLNLSRSQGDIIIIASVT